MRKFFVLLTVLFIFVYMVGASTAHATRLEVSSSSPAWMHIGAAVLLYLHIGGGAIGLVAGVVASLTRKGQRVHRAAGKVFFISMFIAYLIGAGVAPFLADGQRPNFVAAVLALYLLITGVFAAKRKVFQAGLVEVIGLVVALMIVGMGVLFIFMGANSESGTVDGSPPQAFFLFVIVGTAAAVGELNAIIRRRLSNTTRIVRHLWRMCCSFFFASASLFLGQPDVFPEWFNESVLPLLFAFTPIAVLLIWVVIVKSGRMARV